MKIDDVRVIIKSEGKHYSLVPKREIGPEVARQARILLVEALFEVMDVVDVALEDIKPTRPDWLTQDILNHVRGLWESHVQGDNKRIEAIKYLRDQSTNPLSMREALDILHKFIIPYSSGRAL